jgi:hypothetical protein
MILLLAPELQRNGQPIELRLQFSETLFEAGNFLIHRLT